MKNKQVQLVALRKARGLSQRELSNELNFGVSVIGLYESGKRKPPLDKALVIARYFNVPVENIIFETIK